MGNSSSAEREHRLERERQLKREEQQRQQQQQYNLWLKALKAEKIRLEILEQQRQREREEALKRQAKQQQEAAAAAVAAVQRMIHSEYRDQGQPDYGWEDSDYEWNSPGFHNAYPPQQVQQPDWRGRRKTSKQNQPPSLQKTNKQNQPSSLQKTNKQNQPPSGSGRKKRGRKNRGDLYENDYHAGHSKDEIKSMCRERDAAFQARCLKASE